MSGLEERLRALEDRACILDLIAGYGPLADSGNGAGIGALWAEGGSYSFEMAGETTTLRGAEIGGLVELESHRELMAAGCAHFLSAPSVRIDGDTATAVNHSVVLVHRDGIWVAERVSANHWTLTRTDDGWRVANRTNALLTGDESARDLLAR
ncbi:hypothetical protein BN1051_00271 [Arthrobacter saudimassiliensis]|uniref:SnoaL-like domain-containing protein n=1 Tax=Arthrobacter saudimassiliensis TaxID=1461584 RepID=A0A078MQ47_9MICC|nr:hypothetical protein BN1051_00271 [Arthrobacter saudimassiliensis]